MSQPYDRPAYGNPGGCECMKCGVIFVGAEWHTECAICSASRAWPQDAIDQIMIDPAEDPMKEDVE